MSIENHYTSLYAKAQHGVLSMDGYFTTQNENAAHVTAPATVTEAYRADTRDIVATCAGQDGAK